MNILITGAYNYSDSQYRKINKFCSNITLVKDETKLLQIDVSNIDIVICNNLFVYNDIERFKCLKMIHIISSGYDRIPMEYINNNNITIFNAKGVYSIPIAEWVILKILEIYKKSRVFFKQQENFEWKKQRDILELTNKNVFIIGYGDIGVEIAKRLSPFNVKIFAVDIIERKSNLVYKYCNINDIDNLIHLADIIILSLPLTKQSIGFMNDKRLNLMKKNSVLINISRGEIIEENALCHYLSDNKFLGVALDVFSEEPLDASSTLWDNNNVLITPHNSFVSDLIEDRLNKTIIKNLEVYINGRIS